MLILGVETSCDETAAAVAEGGRGRVRILSNVISSQIKIHEKYGGVVPEVAAREHVKNILPAISQALEDAGLNRKNAAQKLDALAVTVGPGLVTSLTVGVETAKTLAMAWRLKTVAVNHIEAHIYANFIGANSNSQDTIAKQNPISKIQYPIIILTVSGGHTMLVLMRGHGSYETVGETRDDAAGETFDKAASMLGLGYPGGPAIGKSASQYLKTHPKISNFVPHFAESNQFFISTDSKLNNSKFIQNSKFKIQNSIYLPRPMIKDKSYDFSFSGLKTALLYALKNDKSWRGRVSEYAAEFQQAVIDVLIAKASKAAEKYHTKNVMLSGGVAANRELREQMAEAVSDCLPHAYFLLPNLEYTTDNAAMVATAGYFHAARRDFSPWHKLSAQPNIRL